MIEVLNHYYLNNFMFCCLLYTIYCLLSACSLQTRGSSRMAARDLPPRYSQSVSQTSRLSMVPGKELARSQEQARGAARRSGACTVAMALKTLEMVREAYKCFKK